MLCIQCQRDIATHFATCPHCNAQLGFPNVREATTSAERDALEQRYQAARDDARHRNCENVLDSFEAVVGQSHALISRPWGTLTKIAERDNEVFKTYCQQLQARGRYPQDNELDRARLAVDATFFPYFFDVIHFASLSLDGRGPAGYGECTFVLRERSIAHRTTVFEENTLVFCRKHVIPVGERPPVGFRATWNERQRLAVGKLYGEISTQTTTADFAGILLKQKGATDADEFIEAHIYGTLDLTAIERFRAPKPKSDEDLVLARRLRRKLHTAGVQVEKI